MPNHATAATGQGTTGAATTADWGQSRHDSEHRGWSPSETAITPANAGGVGEEWNTEGGGTPVIAGGVAYVLSASTLNGTGLLTAYQLATGERLWRISTGSCSAGPIAVTIDLVVLGCSSFPRAYARGSAHDLVWDTQEAEAGQAGLQNLLVIGDRVVAWGSTRVASYQLSDGDRAWNLLLPSGADTLQDVAATGSTVVVAYDDRLRALALSNGTQQWSSPGVVTPQLVIADGWIYTSNASSFGRYALATGAAGWSKPATYTFGRVEAVDSDTVYVWDPQFDFGPPSPSVLRALNTSDGSLRWEYDVPSRVGSVAVTGGVLWLTSTDIYSQGRSGDLIALDRTERRRGEAPPLRRQHLRLDRYRVRRRQGRAGPGRQLRRARRRTPCASSGWPGRSRRSPPRCCRSDVWDRRTPSTLASTVGTASWSCAVGVTTRRAHPLGGRGPHGHAHDGDLRADDAAGHRAERTHGRPSLHPPGGPGRLSGGWTTHRHGTRAATRSTPAPDSSSSRTYRPCPSAGRPPLRERRDRQPAWTWSPPAPGCTACSGTGSSRPGTRRAPPPTVRRCGRSSPTRRTSSGGATIAGDRILVRDDSGTSMRATSRPGPWCGRRRTAPGVPFGYEGPMVVGSTVVVRDSANSVRAYSLATGAPLWGGDCRTGHRRLPAAQQ